MVLSVSQRRRLKYYAEIKTPEQRANWICELCQAGKFEEAAYRFHQASWCDSAEKAELSFQLGATLSIVQREVLIQELKALQAYDLKLDIRESDRRRIDQQNFFLANSEHFEEMLKVAFCRVLTAGWDLGWEWTYYHQPAYEAGVLEVWPLGQSQEEIEQGIDPAHRPLRSLRCYTEPPTLAFGDLIQSLEGFRDLSYQPEREGQSEQLELSWRPRSVLSAGEYAEVLLRINLGPRMDDSVPDPDPSEVEEGPVPFGYRRQRQPTDPDAQTPEAPPPEDEGEDHGESDQGNGA